MPGGNVVRFGGTFDTRAVESGMKRIESGFAGLPKKVEAGFSKIGSGIATGIKAGIAIAAVGITAFASQVAVGLRSLVDLERIGAQTTAVIKSTGGAAGVSAGQVRLLAEKYEALNATIDDKVIQSAENMLLTFTSVNKDAFEPALQAILNMNTAMGGGEEGLQTTVIQVGKALNDPIKGITALRKVGVSFTEDQQKVIKRLVETGDTLGAQKIILAELDKEFGGSFLGEGNTTAGKVAKVKDAIEDAQKALATGFLPVLSRVADILTKKLADPAVLTQLQNIGEKVAGLFTDANIAKGEEFAEKVWGKLGEVPWGTIGDGLKIAADASKVAVDAFLKLPPNVQGGLITLLAANKLTGGAVASGIGDIAGFVLKSVGSKIFAANVTVVGTNVIGGGGGFNPANLLPGAAGAAGAGAAGFAGLSIGATVAAALASAAVVFAVGTLVAEVGHKAHPEIFLDPHAPSTPPLRTVDRDGNPILPAATKEAMQDTAHLLAKAGLDDQRRGERQGAAYDTLTQKARETIEKLEAIRAGVVALPAGISAFINSLPGGSSGNPTPPTTLTQSTTDSILRAGGFAFQTGFLGTFNRPTKAIFGEAGQETLAILRNPRQGMLSAPAASPGVNVYVSIDNKHIIKRTRRAEVWHSVVAQ